MGPDRALIYAVLNGGIPAFNEVKRRGIQADDLFGNDVEIFKLFESYIPKGRLPSYDEIALLAKVPLPQNSAVLDPAACAEVIYKRKLSTKLNDGLGRVSDLIVSNPEEARTKLQELLQTTVRTHGRIRHSNAAETIDEIRDRYLAAELKPDGLLGLSSPWPSLDKQSLGLQKGELHVIFAKRKVGKTNLALAWVEHIWAHDLKPSENILIISMEMPPWQVNQRLFATRNRLDYAQFRGGKLSQVDRQRFLDWCDAMKVADPTTPQVVVVGSDVVRETNDIVSLASQYNAKAILVDGFYILGKGSKKQKWERVTENAESLKLDVAIPLDVPVIATTQLSGAVGKQDLDADTDAAAFAKGIGDYADASYGLFMDDMLRAQEKRILSVMDARDFIPVRLQINFSLQKQLFSEIKVISDDGFGDVGPSNGMDLPDFDDGGQLAFE
jgi:hypothetical protein